MSCRIVTAEIFDAFLKCETKAYFKSAGQTGEPDELVSLTQNKAKRANKTLFLLLITG
jgi:hypothetical protein